MHGALRGRVRRSTIAHSNWVGVVGLLALVACGEPRRPAATVEGVAPHLRAPAVPHAHQDGPATPVPDPSASKDVSLAGILAFADRHSPVLAIARSTRTRAAAARAAAQPLLPANPEVTVAAGPRMGRAGSGVDLDVSLMQQIQIAGERGLRLDAANRFGEVVDAEVEQTRWAVHCDVHAGFHRALVERERLKLADRVVAFQEEVLRVVKKQISAGEAPPLSLRLAEAEVAQARQVRVGAEQAFVASRIRLAQLTGWPIARPPNPAGIVDAPQEPPAQERLVAVARERLPSLRAGLSRVREAEARMASADRDRWPRPSLGVQYRREDKPAEGVFHIAMGVVSLPIPSFQTNQAERARANADAAVARAELGAAGTLLEAHIAEARSEVVAAAQRTRAYGTEIVPRLEENLTLLRRSFELGEIDILALSTGRERFLRIQNDALGAQLDYFVALAGLERVVGVDLWHDHHHEGKTP